MTSDYPQLISTTCLMKVNSSLLSTRSTSNLFLAGIWALPAGLPIQSHPHPRPHPARLLSHAAPFCRVSPCRTITLAGKSDICSFLRLKSPHLLISTAVLTLPMLHVPHVSELLLNAMWCLLVSDQLIGHYMCWLHLKHQSTRNAK